MEEDILIVKKKKGQEKFTAKIRKKVKKDYAPDKFLKTFNPADYSDISLLLQDLETFGCPIEKAINKFRKDKSSPFW